MFKSQPDRTRESTTEAVSTAHSRAWILSDALGSRRMLHLVILTAVLLRIAAAFYLGDEVSALPGTYDQISYDALARRVLDGHGFTFGQDWWPATPAGQPTAHWSFLYTLYLTVAYALFGAHPIVPRLIQAVAAGILQPWLCARIAGRLFGSATGALAAAVSAVYAYFIYYAAALMTETFYLLAILWMLDLALTLGSDPQRRSKLKYWACLGLAIGLGSLLRQIVLLFVPFLLAWLLLRVKRTERPGAAARLVLTGLVAAAMIAPWTLRNYQAFDRVVLLNTNAGFAFYWSNHPHHGVSFQPILSSHGPSYRELLPADLTGLNEAALDQALLRRGMDFVLQDPLRYLRLCLSRAKEYFKFWPSPDSTRISNLARVSSFGVALPFMVLGLLVVLVRMRGKLRPESSRARESALLYLFMLFHTLLHLASWTLVRYRLPVDAVLVMFAAVGVVSLLQWERFGLRRRRILVPSDRRSLARLAVLSGKGQGRQPAGGNS